MGNYSFVPDPSRLAMAQGWDSLAVVLAGAAALFVIVVLLYFLLRGRRTY